MKKFLKAWDFNLDTYYRKYVILLICVCVTYFLPTQLDEWYKVNPYWSLPPTEFIISSNVKLFLYTIILIVSYELIILTYKKLKTYER